MVTAYLARGMSNRPKTEVVIEASADKMYFEMAGITVNCPVTREGVKKGKGTIKADKKLMDSYWPADKQLIRDSHVVIDMTPTLKSEGVAHEIGFARYFLFKPVIRVFPWGQLPPDGSIAAYEDDVVVDSREEAIEWLYRVYGTPWKRLKWKVALVNRCLSKYVYTRLNWMVDWI